MRPFYVCAFYESFATRNQIDWPLLTLTVRRLPIGSKVKPQNSSASQPKTNQLPPNFFFIAFRIVTGSPESGSSSLANLLPLSKGQEIPEGNRGVFNF